MFKISSRKSLSGFKKAYWLVCLLIPLFFSGCGAKQVPPPQLVFAKDAITIKYQADKQLNSFDDKSHSLLIVVYQLSDVNVFNSYAGYREGLLKILDATSFDASVTAFHKEYIEPGSKGTLKLDRAEKTKHIGIVAGFYDLIPSKCSTLIDITYTTGRHGLLLTKSTTVDPLNINLILEKDGLRVEEKENDS